MSDLKYGKNTVQVEAVLAEVETWTAAEAKIAGAARDAVRYEARYAARVAACGAALSAGRGAAWDEAWFAARDAVLNAVRGVMREAVRDSVRWAVRDSVSCAARDAAVCALVSDLISEEHQEVLNVGLNAVREYRVKKENASAHGDTRRRALAEWARKRAKKARKKAERSGGTVHQYERADILGEIADALEGGEE